jgi:mannose-6-phosphate isomerase-like protein (cupin superfamily)
MTDAAFAAERPNATPLQRNAHAFKLRAQLLKQGRTDTVMAQTDAMQIRLKIYASGGENALHTHLKEDHTFLVLQGSARFYDENEVITDVGKNSGMFIPAGAYYRFEATSKEELVMFRVGARKGGEGPSRLNIRGEPMDGHSDENKTEPVIYKDGQFYE